MSQFDVEIGIQAVLADERALFVAVAIIAPLLITTPAIADADSHAALCQMWNQVLQDEPARDAQIQSQALRLLSISPSQYGAMAASMMAGIGPRQAQIMNEMAAAGCVVR